MQTIGIIGGGVVGGAVKNYFRDAKVYDKYKSLDTLEEVVRCKFIFVAVPTPNNNGLDLSIMDEVIENITRHLTDPENQLIVIKSTALPGTTQSYQDRYPNANFAFNPEFLRDKSANEDFIRTDRQIVGYTTKNKNSPMLSELMSLLPIASYQKIMQSESAELIKYSANTFLALQVIFANQIYDLCKVLDIDYEAVKDAVQSDKRIGKSHWDIWHTESSTLATQQKQYRGYGGKCFPKDMNSLVDFGKKIGIDVSLFEAAQKVNLALNGGKYDR